MSAPVVLFTALAGLASAILLACASADPIQPPACPPDPFAYVVSADTGWRARVQAIALSVPSDTTLEAHVGYRDSVTDADRVVLQGAGATVTYEFAGSPALGIRLTAGQLVALTVPDGPLPDSRIDYVELGLRVCPAEAHAFRGARPRNAETLDS